MGFMRKPAGNQVKNSDKPLQRATSSYWQQNIKA